MALGGLGVGWVVLLDRRGVFGLCVGGLGGFRGSRGWLGGFD